MPRFFLAVWFVGLLVVSPGCDLLGDDDLRRTSVVPFEYIPEAGHLQLDQPGGTAVFRDSASWEAFFFAHRLTDSHDVPSIDFDSRMLIVLHWAERNGCAHRVDFEVLLHHQRWGDLNLEVTIGPLSDRACTAVFHPIQIISVPNHPVPVEFSGNVP